MDYRAFGDGWAVKITVGALAILPMIAGAIAGWAARRPIEKAGMLEVVNSRLTLYLTHIEAEIGILRLALAKCEAKHELQGAEIEQLRGQLMQEKQIGMSAKAARNRDGGT